MLKFKTKTTLLLAALIPALAFGATGSGDFGGGISQSQVGQPNGVASLDNTGKVPLSQIPGGGGSATWGSITGTLSSQTDLDTALNGKQASLGFTPEDVANKSIDGTLSANSDTLYPSQKAVKTYADTKQPAFTPGTISTSTGGVHIVGGSNSTVGPSVTVDADTASGSQPGLLSAADWTTFNSKQNAFAGTTLQYVRGDASLATLDTSVVPENSNLYFTNARAQGAVSATAPLVDTAGVFSIPVSTNSVDGYLSAADHTAFAAKQATVLPGHDLWVDRNGSDSNNCSIAAPCQTVGFALTLVTSPSSTNNWTIHLLSGRHDQETNDLLLPIYTWIVGNGGPDVGSYLRLPAGKAIKLDSSWAASNGRGGIQSVYLGGGTSVDLDFAAGGGSAGSNFMLDDVFVTGSFNHTGRGVNGGDFLVLQNSMIFGAATLTASELQSNETIFASTLTAATSTTVGSDLTFMGGQVVGAFSFTQGSGQTATLSTSGTTYPGGFTTVGTVALTADLNLPIGYTLSGGTTRTNTADAKSVPYTPAVSGNWSPVPTEVSGALDQLAARPSGSGDVTGPASSTDNNVVFFNGTTGKIIKDSGLTLAGSNTGDVTIGTANGLSLVGQALSLALASTSTTGALSSTDWNTFNGKQAAGNYITDLTGDGTASGPGSVGFTLATVNSNVGAFGSASSVATFNVNGKGLITAAASAAIQITESQVTNLTTDLAAKQSRILTVTDGGDAAYTILSTDDEVRAGTTLTADRAYTLPACAGGNVGERHIVKNPPAQTFNVTLTAAGTDLIDGNATMTVLPSQSLTVICGAAAVWDIN